MKFIMSVLLLSLVAVGCDRVEGQLNVVNEFKLRNSKGNNHAIAIGTYSADIRKSTFGKNIVLRLNNDKNEKFEFKIPDGANIPSNGSFFFKSQDINQGMDLNGVVATKVTDSPTRDMFQQCSYTEPYTVCSPSGPNGQTVCQTYMRTVNGSQWIRYYDHNVDQNIHLTLLTPATSNSAAEFTGDVSYAQRIVVSQTPCR